MKIGLYQILNEYYFVLNTNGDNGITLKKEIVFVLGPKKSCYCGCGAIMYLALCKNQLGFIYDDDDNDKFYKQIM